MYSLFVLVACAYIWHFRWVIIDNNVLQRSFRTRGSGNNMVARFVDTCLKRSYVSVCISVCLQRTSVVRTITHSAFGGLISSRDFTDVAVTVENDQFISTNGTFAGAWLLFGWWHGWVGESGEIRSVDIVHSH